MVTALFAINEIYPMGDKRAIEILKTTNKVPPNFVQKLEVILCADKNNLPNNIVVLKALWKEIVSLTGGLYSSSYIL